MTCVTLLSRSSTVGFFFASLQRPENGAGISDSGWRATHVGDAGGRLKKQPEREDDCKCT